MPIKLSSRLKHPYYGRWSEDEARQRASYIATRRILAPFLVQHRFEGDRDPIKLPRSRYGYGFGINRAYLSDIFGHIRGTPVDRGTGMPDAQWETFKADATGDGTTWDNLIEGQGLEWMCTSPGALLVVDRPNDGDGPTTVTLVPSSNVWDVGRSQQALRWVRLVEEIDDREAGESYLENSEYAQFLVYRLVEGGETEVRREDGDGQVVEDWRSLGKFTSRTGRPVLPIRVARLGVHGDIPWLGRGLLEGLDDIVIDLFNVYSETREAFRDAAFALLVYRGADLEEVRRMLLQGSRLIGIGADEKGALDRLVANSSEVEAGLSLIGTGLQAWALSAKRKAAEAAVETGQARSGISLVAEFNLDQRPMLIRIAEELDAIESDVLWLVNQIEGRTPTSDQVYVKRSTDFRQEDEAERIARLVKDFAESLPLPAIARQKITLEWLKQADVIDLEEEIALTGEATTTVAELAEQQAAALAEANQQQQENAALGGLFPEG